MKLPSCRIALLSLFSASVLCPVGSSSTPYQRPQGLSVSLACVIDYILVIATCTRLCSNQVKIDYQPRTLKVGALQHGDYLELLNLFPLEGVHLTLQKLLLSGVSGWNGVTQLLLQVTTSGQAAMCAASVVADFGYAVAVWACHITTWYRVLVYFRTKVMTFVSKARHRPTHVQATVANNWGVTAVARKV